MKNQINCVRSENKKKSRRKKIFLEKIKLSNLFFYKISKIAYDFFFIKWVKEKWKVGNLLPLSTFLIKID